MRTLCPKFTEKRVIAALFFGVFMSFSTAVLADDTGDFYIEQLIVTDSYFYVVAPTTIPSNGGTCNNGRRYLVAPSDGNYEVKVSLFFSAYYGGKQVRISYDPVTNGACAAGVTLVRGQQ